METVKFVKEVQIADADGIAISKGSVLQDINEEGTTGVVMKIYREGDYGPPASQIGDMEIQTGRGMYRISNRYDQWRHIPHEEQTYEQRFLSWVLSYTDNMFLGLEHLSEDERKAVNGILAVLPSEAVDWEWGPVPDSFEGALEILVKYLSKIDKEVTE